MASTSAYMPLFVADFMVSTQSFTQAQLGCYIRLLCFAWSEGGLPNDYEACSRIAGGMPKEDWAVIRKRLQVFDQGTSEERLSHTRLEDVRVKANRAYESRVAGAEKARRRRLGQEPISDHQPDHQVDHQVDHQSHAHASDDRMQPKPNPNPKPKPKPNPLKGNLESPNGDSRHASPAARPPRVYRITWSLSGGFEGITDQDRKRWRAAFPAVDVDAWLPRIHEYLISRPSKQRKRNWPKFLFDWFSRKQEEASSAAKSVRRNCL